MAEMQKTKRPLMAKIALGVLALFVILVLLVIGFRLFLTTGSGARFVENQVNSRSYGPVDRIQISGLSGDPLKSVTVERIEVLDVDGAWITLRDVTLDWNAYALLRRHIDIRKLSISQGDMIRRPVLKESEGQSGSGTTPRVTLSELSIDTFDLGEAVMGQTASFKTDGALAFEPGEDLNAQLDIVRTDEAGDALSLAIKRDPTGDIRASYELTGQPNGPVATLIQAPSDRAVRGAGLLEGSAEAGQGTLTLSSADAPLMSLSTDWDVEAFRFQAEKGAAQWPLFESLPDALNGFTLNGTVSREENRRFELRYNAQAGRAIISGMRPVDNSLPDSFSLNASLKSPLGSIEAAEGYDVADIALDGIITGLNSTSITYEGDAKAQGLSSPYGQADTVQGPVKLTLLDRKALDSTLQLTITNAKTNQNLPISLNKTVILKGTGRYEFVPQTLSDLDMSLTTGADTLTAKGRANIKSKQFNIVGQVKASLIERRAMLAGRLDADYSIGGDNLLTIKSDGRYRLKDQIEGPASAVIGETLLFQTEFTRGDERMTINMLDVSTNTLKLALNGTVSDKLNISGEVLTTEAIAIGSLTAASETTASFVVSGTRDNPSVRLDATSPIINIGSQTLESVRLRTELEGPIDRISGPIQIDMETQYGPFTGSANIARQDNQIGFSDVGLSVDRLQADGDIGINIDTKLVTGAMRVTTDSLDPDTADINVNFSEQGVQQRINIDGKAENLAVGDWRLDVFEASLSGVLSDMNGKVVLSGVYGSDIFGKPISLETPLAISFVQANEETPFSVAVEVMPDAKFGMTPIKTLSPTQIFYQASELKVASNLSVGTGAISLDFHDKGNVQNLVIDGNDIPVALLPLPNRLRDSRGRVSVAADISTQNKTPKGEFSVQLKDWRGNAMSRGEGIDATLRGFIDQGVYRLTLQGQSEPDLRMNGQALIPLTNEGRFFGLAPDVAKPITGRFAVSGAAAPLIGLALIDESDIEGSVIIETQISGSLNAPKVSGKAQANGIGFELTEYGTQIRGGVINASFSNDSLRVDEFSFQDAKSGKIAGQGTFKLGLMGQPMGELNLTSTNFTLSDRRDLSAVLSGELTYTLDANGGKLSGQTRLPSLDVKEFVSAGYKPVDIEVTEINRPETDIASPPRQNMKPTRLDVVVKAPRQVFVRSRGLDIELSVDAQIKGTSAKPLIYGTANVIRGGYKIAGKTLSFEKGEITFDGAFNDAKINFIANTVTPNLKAGVTITGTVSAPEVTLTSTPERPQDEILSALLFGRSVTELSPVEGVQLASALAQLSGVGGGFDIVGGLRSVIGIDQLSLDVAQDGATRVVGGKYLTKDVYLQVFSGVGASDTGAIIDWDIRKNLALRSRLRADNDRSLSLKWKRDF